MRDQPLTQDPRTLLCESCGYVLDGLHAESVCPECGRSVASSLPSARVGSRWQIGPGVGGWLGTFADLIRAPKSLFERILAEPAWGLLGVNLGLSALVFGLGVLVQALLSRRDLPDLEYLPGIAIGSVGTGLLASAVFAGLTTIEVVGVGFWSKRLGRRLPTRVTWSICAHASYAWLLAAALSGLGWAMSPFLHYQISNLNFTWITPVTALGLLVVSGAFAGMLVFETLVYMGVRRCRFINTHPRAGEPGDHRGTAVESPGPAQTDADPTGTP